MKTTRGDVDFIEQVGDSERKESSEHKLPPVELAIWTYIGIASGHL